MLCRISLLFHQAAEAGLRCFGVTPLRRGQACSLLPLCESLAASDGEHACCQPGQLARPSGTGETTGAVEAHVTALFMEMGLLFQVDVMNEFVVEQTVTYSLYQQKSFNTAKIRKEGRPHQAEQAVSIEDELVAGRVATPHDGVHAPHLVVAGHHHQVVVDALQVGLLQLQVDVLRDQVDGHVVLVPGQPPWSASDLRLLTGRI